MDRPRRRSSPPRLADWRDASELPPTAVEAPGVREVAVPERAIWIRLRGGRWWPGLQDAWRYLPATGDWAIRIRFGPDQEPKWFRYKGVAVHPATGNGYPPEIGTRP